MRKLDWKETAELLGIFAILASLIFVAMQLQQQEKLLQVELRSNMVANYMTVNGFIIENPDIWIRGNAGEELTATEREVYFRLLTNYNDHHFQLIEMFKTIHPDLVEQIFGMYAGFLSRNPGAYRLWLERDRQIHADRIALNPAETLSSDWIEAIESRMEIINPGSTRAAP